MFITVVSVTRLRILHCKPFAAYAVSTNTKAIGYA